MKREPPAGIRLPGGSTGIERQPPDGAVAASDRAAELMRLWADAAAQVAAVLHAKVEPGFSADLDSAADALAALVLRDADVAIAHVVRPDETRSGAVAAAHYASRHATQAGITALLAARHLGWPAPACATVLRAALTMNVGMFDLQNRLASQTSPLTELQRQAIRSHPQRSAELLRAGGVTNPDWLEAVERHHERPDRSGYPEGLGELGEPALMLSRVDDFTAKFAARALRPALTADKAVRQFHQAHPEDPLTAAIVAEFGVYPPGCAVRLQSGEIGVVMRRGGARAAPIVVAVRGRSGDALPAPLRRDTNQPEHAIANAVSTAAVRVRLTLDQLLAACDA